METGRLCIGHLARVKQQNEIGVCKKRPMRNLGNEAVNFSRSVVPATTPIARAIFMLNRENMGDIL